jgi:hypothetical protein
MREAHGLAQSKDPYFVKARNMTSFDAIISAMRTTVALDDDLVRTAQELTSVAEVPWLTTRATPAAHADAVP